jgi:hypothetical protein
LNPGLPDEASTIGAGPQERMGVFFVEREKPLDNRGKGQYLEDRRMGKLGFQNPRSARAACYRMKERAKGDSMNYL